MAETDLKGSHAALRRQVHQRSLVKIKRPAVGPTNPGIIEKPKQPWRPPLERNMPPELCTRCGAVIPANAEAHVWLDEHIVCGPCRNQLQHEQHLSTTAVAFAGKPGAPWTVKEGDKELGPYFTNQLIEMLRSDQIAYSQQLWRDGMTMWRQVSQLFTIAQFSQGRIELRDHGQGDGTYHPA